MAEKACHTFASTTQVGLTQTLGRYGRIRYVQERSKFFCSDGISIAWSKSRIYCHGYRRHLSSAFPWHHSSNLLGRGVPDGVSYGVGLYPMAFPGIWREYMGYG